MKKISTKGEKKEKMTIIGEIVRRREKEILVSVMDMNQSRREAWFEKEKVQKTDNGKFIIPEELSMEKLAISAEILLPDYEDQLKRAEEDIEEKEMKEIARIMTLAIREAKKIVYEEMSDLELTPGQRANEIERIAVTLFISARGGYLRQY